MNEKTCKKCVWFDQCGQEKVCEYYDPVSIEEAERAAEAEYEDDLLTRHKEYKEAVKEMKH